MYRIRFHGRGGQGIRTSSRILGSAFFSAGYEVQDAPRYGAERRGAPVFAYVRADKKRIFERGVIHVPDLAVVADETLLSVAANQVFEGLRDDSVVVVISPCASSEFKELHCLHCNVITVPESLTEDKKLSRGLHSLSIIASAAASALTGAVTFEHLEQGIRAELGDIGSDSLSADIELSAAVYKSFGKYSGIVRISENTSSGMPNSPAWVKPELQALRLSTPAIYKSGTSVNNQTGSWRTERPVIDKEKCSRCTLCYILCPDCSITLNEDKYPEIDYIHCKGCLICSQVCPAHAITSEYEHILIKEVKP